MLTLVVDTNLFHEFRPIDTLPWSEITDADEIILLVSDPVQTELDEQKKSSRARIKRRALEWVKRFRKLLKAGETDLVVVEGSPRVVLRLDDTSPSKEHKNVLLLDLAVADDADQPARAALRDVIFRHRLERRFPLQPRRRQLFPSRSFRIELSSMLSASSFFSLAFSVSRVFSRRTSDTSIPPNFAFHL